MLKVGLAGAATAASPAILRLTAEAQSGPIKIGLPLALTGPLGSVGQQTKRGAELYAKLQNAKGGIAGRPIELLIEDTVADSAHGSRSAGARDQFAHGRRDEPRKITTMSRPNLNRCSSAGDHDRLPRSLP